MIALLWLAASAVQAQTRYVSDSLVITVRSGPSTQNSIARNLTSGDRVVVIEELVDEGYSLVTLEDGEQGWVLSRYLQDEPTAEQRLATTTRALAESERSASNIAAISTELESELIATRQALEQAESNAAAVTSELADIRSASAAALETRAQNSRLQNRVSSLTAELDLAEMEIRELRSRNRQSWFIVGAGVLFGGIVIGLVAPSLRRKRRSSW